MWVAGGMVTGVTGGSPERGIVASFSYSYFFLFLLRMRLRCLSQVNYDRLCQAVLGTHSVAVPEELQETEPSFEYCCTVAKGPLDRLPRSHARTCQGHCPGSRNPFTGGLTISPIISQSPIDQGDDDVSDLVEIPSESDVLFVENETPPCELDRNPQQNGKQH